MKTPYYDYMFENAAISVYINHYNPTFKLMMTSILNNLKKSRMFKIPKDLAFLFTVTDSSPMYNLPYEAVFLETSFNVEGMATMQESDLSKIQKETSLVEGLLLIQNVNTNNKIIIMGKLKSKDGIKGTFGSILNQEINNLNEFPASPKVNNFVNNFLCFINSPDIKYITKIDSKRDTKIRIRKGKPPRPMIASIKLTNPLKRYINKQRQGVKMIYSHRFWVRGHWRTLRHKRYGKNVGKKLWIKPHIKGDGLLIPKNYELVSESPITEVSI